MIQKRRTNSYASGPKKSEINVEDIRVVDYKNVELLKHFTDSCGRVVSHRRSKLNAKQQREVSLAIKYARFLGLMPYIAR